MFTAETIEIAEKIDVTSQKLAALEITLSD
jgi:hypothetical protein